MDDPIGKLKGASGVLGREVKKTSGAALSQLGIENSVERGQLEKENSLEKNSSLEKANQDFVKGMYESSNQGQDSSSDIPNFSKVLGIAPEKPKSPEELAKIQMVQKKLKNEQHQKEYYQPLTQRPVEQTEREQEKEMRPADRVERLELKDLQETKKKKQKMTDAFIAERKVETFRGAMG